MKTFIFISTLLISSLGFADDIKMIKHKVQSHETAWFLSQVFFGHGSHYKELLAMNDLKTPDELKYGKEIIVMKPKFHPGQKDFAARYNQIKEERSEKLYRHKKPATYESHYNAKEVKHRGVASEVSTPVKTVEVPEKSVSEAKAKAELPFTSVKDPRKTPADQAREELEKY